MTTSNKNFKVKNGLDVNGEITALAIGGDEGGQLNLAKPATGTTLSSNVAIDIYQNRLRIFDQGGTNKGAYIDLSVAADGVGSDLLSGSGGIGQDGLSAYEVAVANGFVGTEQDWLDSLVGPQGPAGADGAQGIQGIQGIQGVKGDKGDTGNTGATGPTGPQGDPGPMGPSGIAYANAPLSYDSGTQTVSISVGTTSGTVAAGDHTHSQSDITNLTTDLAAKAPLASPAITGNASVDNLTINGSLTFNGTATNINSTNLEVTDSMIYLAAQQYDTDTVDIGIYGAYGDSQAGHFHTGIVRDATDGKWKLISNGTEPTGNVVDFASVNYDTLKLGGIESNTTVIGEGYSNSNPALTVYGSYNDENDIQSWRNDNAGEVARITNDGSFVTNNGLTASTLYANDMSGSYLTVANRINGNYTVNGQSAYINMPSNDGTTGFSIDPGTTGSTGLEVKGRNGQTAPLQVWRDFTNAVLAKISANGKLTATIDGGSA